MDLIDLIEYAKSELDRIYDEEALKEPYNKMAYDAIMELITTFSNQGHSGFSRSYVLKYFSRLAEFKPITPLTGEPDEWDEIHGTWQNKRCSSVFKKSENGQAYDIKAKIFSDDAGMTWFTCSKSRVNVEFPYMPPDEPERVILEEENNDGGDLLVEYDPDLSGDYT